MAKEAEEKRHDQARVVLTKRTKGLRFTRGYVSSDFRGAAATARRESQIAAAPDAGSS